MAASQARKRACMLPFEAGGSIGEAGPSASSASEFLNVGIFVPRVWCPRCLSVPAIVSAWGIWGRQGRGANAAVLLRFERAGLFDATRLMVMSLPAGERALTGVGHAQRAPAATS